MQEKQLLIEGNVGSSVFSYGVLVLFVLKPYWIIEDVH
jgi:hypothetical protein